MTKPKILFIIESLNVGGAEKALVSLLSLLNYSEMDVTLLLISESGRFVKDANVISDLKISHVIKPRSSKFTSIINALKIKCYYKWLPPKYIGNTICRGYDIVIAFTEGFLTKWIGASTENCKKIAWVHTDMINNDWPVKTGVFSNVEEEHKAYLNFDEVITVSESVAEGMRKKFGLKNITTIYNILDCSIQKKAQSKIKYQPTHKLNLISVGRLEPVKGYDVLIEALSCLVNHHGLDISLCLVGDGSSRSYLEKMVKDYNLQNYVFFAGEQANPYPFIAVSDVYVCSSKQEGFNIAILEAMSLGKPVVTTNSVGPREILADGDFGLLIENDLESLIEAIYSISKDPDNLVRLSKLSQQRASQFSSEVQIKKINEILKI